MLDVPGFRVLGFRAQGYGSNRKITTSTHSTDGSMASHDRIGGEVTPEHTSHRDLCITQAKPPEIAELSSGSQRPARRSISPDVG